MKEEISLRGHAAAARLAQRDPRVKVVWTLAFVLYAVTLPDGCWGVYLGSALALGGIAWAGGVRWQTVLWRSRLALPFALTAVSTAFTWPGHPWLTFPLGPWMLTITAEGGVHFLSILLRAWLAAQAIALLGLTTPFPQWMWAFRRLGVPAELVTMLSLLYRYLFLLAEEGRRLQRARVARLVQPLPGRHRPGPVWQLRATGNMVGHLFLRSYARAERVYQAMLARGYRGTWPALDHHRLSREDWLLGAVGILLLLLVQGMVRL